MQAKPTGDFTGLAGPWTRAAPFDDPKRPAHHPTKWEGGEVSGHSATPPSRSPAGYPERDGTLKKIQRKSGHVREGDQVHVQNLVAERHDLLQARL